mmetsp:Transcript_33286/g.43897  ORF Transcript_33286/g.43897 Transcript_33286/m.43897 type:complete len:377 (-) Transcript_33286:393-1523(-)|eukprot:CAMPEP_0117733356 /NCGR_PEP_ID=MMETSP0947-20121206/29_1 /TAXON_ID=44440 /ORGANISM="Chattonella subsalsa, Strain CCMP2191" /LENGTH=376 /DNA_ID=CAMNT_0005547927 /DNA_START=98 /DNA_END=1228 /DNA_ORIENTATION=-
MSLQSVFVFFAAVCVLCASLVNGLATPSGIKLPAVKSVPPPPVPSKADGADLSELMLNNQAWALEKLSNNPEYFKNLASGQAPRYLWVGCSDSRVPAEIVMGTEPGEVFVHRNVANQVVTSDPNFIAVLTYAIDYLGVEDIIVCGHTKCGGVAASSSSTDFGPVLESWLINLREVFAVNGELFAGIEDEDEKQRKLVELNTKAQCLKLMTHPTVQKKQKETGGIPRIHGMIFDMEEGLLKDVEYEADLLKNFLSTQYMNFQVPEAPEGANAQMVPKSGIRTKLSKLFKKAPVEEEAAPVEEPVASASSTNDYERLLKWMLHLGCPEYAEPIFNAGFRKFDLIAKFGLSEKDIEGIVPAQETGVRKLLTTGHHASYF